jgi:MFS superfamily sulfate permease-like transporter
MKGFNFLLVPLSIVAFLVVTLFANAVMFSATEKAVIYSLSILVIGIFFVLAGK